LASGVGESGLTADYNKSNIEVLFHVAVSLYATWVKSGKYRVVNALIDLE
jgi:hypothetical protein